MKKVVIGLLMLAVVLGILRIESTAEAMAGVKEKGKRMKFAGIYEPSGIAQLPDGRLLVIEDEKVKPFSLCPLTLEDGQVSIGAPVPCSGEGAADDLEGITLGPDGWVYAITSHSPAGDGASHRERERLLRFKVDAAGRIERFQEYDGLLPVLLKSVRELDPTVAAINVEGLSFDRGRKTLLIGLREPVIAGASLVLVLENPEGIFAQGEAPRIASESISLHLLAGGIRAITYDSRLAGYLIANEIPQKGGKIRACLWLWDGIAGHEARRLDFPGNGKVKNIEGISPIVVEGRQLVLLVCDDGDRKEGEGARYQFVEYEQLIPVDAQE